MIKAPGAYRAGLELGRLTRQVADASIRLRDRVWLALLDLDEVLERRVEKLERELAELQEGMGDAQRPPS